MSNENTLLLEIGTEEIPAGYIEPALHALASMLSKQLTHARISHGDAKIMGTPKRLAVEIADVAEKQASLTEEVTGPPEKVGFDETGHPTVAAQKFAEKIGIPVGNLRVKETEKGRYLCAERTEEGQPSRDILAKLLPDAILATPFPKTMKWADLDICFARPIHSVLALLGKTVVPFKLGNIESGNAISGHRFMHPEMLTLDDPGEYVEKLRSASVLVDLEERKQIVEQEVARVAGELGGSVLPDSELVDVVKNLVEYPIAVAGKFDTGYLEVPDEVLITAMREHQKYFAVIDEKGRLMPCFIAVNNTRTKDLSLAATGHERVLRARLADAQFFYRSDLDTSFDDWLEKLKRVLFLAQLGSVHDKVMRVRQIAEFLADESGQDSEFKHRVGRAAKLCKTDLVSQVVVEFPKLQGIMGRVYATDRGEHKDVASAIEAHYRPTHSGGPLPETLTGAILAIADKVDSIGGCFSAGFIPTGAADPYALRRQGIGIIQIMHERGLSFSLRRLIEKSVSIFGKGEQEIRETTAKVYTFLQQRMSHLLVEEGFSRDAVAAIVDVSVDHVPNVRNRVRALEKLKTEPDFAPLAIAFKRVVNIIRKADYVVMGNVDDSLFDHECEPTLLNAYKEVSQKVSDNLKNARFDQALLDIASLKEPVDAFFDGVMVMTENTQIRDNRLALLKQIADLFGEFADFSKIST